MPKTIKIRMSRQSIQEAIKELERERVKFLEKVKLFTRMLANDGVQIALYQIRTSIGDSQPPNITLDIDEGGDYCSAYIQISGKDFLFVEFGAGISYNPSNPPHAAQYGMGVGTYPGQTHAYDKGWWYIDDNGNKHYSRGTQGTAPLWNARETIRNEAIITALQIFRS